jgi:protein-tyrosine-phosphatase
MPNILCFIGAFCCYHNYVKILFVCWANVGRSQMAASFYNHLTGTKNANSAGTEVEMPGETLGERRKRRGGTFVITAMADEGIDVSDNIATQLTPKMLENYDVIISMADEKYTPVWLSNNPRYVSWVIEDPGNKGLPETNEAKNKV